MKLEALHYDQLTNQGVQCNLCPHHCRLQEGKTGLCRVRVNEAGSLKTLNYGEVTSLALDPIEKKPLYHFYPGSNILSIGSWGCNFACDFCQNYRIAQQTPQAYYVAPERIVELAQEYQSAGSIGVAFTYNEPSIWYEYIKDVAPMLKAAGFKVVLVTNGFIEKKPLQELVPFIDAVNVDVKAFQDDFYRRICRGRLKPVQENVEYLLSRVHTEITNLIIPGLNDKGEEIRELSRWLASLNADTPLHLSRYHPAYKMNLPPTTETIMRQSYAIAREYLPYVYIGNLPGEDNNTYCKNCNNLLMSRKDYVTNICGIKDGVCSKCNKKFN
jgi:pyruvate formate lyase activating enzyme